MKTSELLKLWENTESCQHDYIEKSQDWCKTHGIDHYGMFCHVYQCKKCGKIVSQDSSG